MKTRGFIFVLVLSLAVAPHLQGQAFQDPDFQKIVWKGLDNMYSYKFDEAKVCFREARFLFPDHPGPYCLLALNGWWENILSEPTPYLGEELLGVLDTAILLGKNYKNQPAFEMEMAYCNFVSYLIRSTFLGSQRKWLKAAGDARKAMPHLRKAIKHTERLPEFYFISGMYHYWADVIPEKYFLARPFMIFFPDGDKALGIQELELATKSHNFTLYESMYFLTTIYLSDIKDYKKGLKAAGKAYKKYPANLWLKGNYGHALALNGRYKEAEKVLKEMIEKFESQEGWNYQRIDGQTSYYTSYLMMRIYHFMGQVQFLGYQNYREAMECFQKSLLVGKLSQVDNHDMLAGDVFMIGRCYDGIGNREKALEYYTRALKMDQNVYIREDARACLDKPCP